MKLWKNTATLDRLLEECSSCVELKEAELAIIGSKPIPLEDMPRLKGLFKCGVGTDNVPFEECERRGIRVCLPSESTASIIYEETASFATSLIFRMLFSDVGTISPWKKAPRVASSRRKVLVIGTGNIGSRVVKKLLPTVSVSSYDIAVQNDSSLEDLLAEADVVSLHIPLTDENRSWFGPDLLGKMKDGAALVNTARGPIVDEEALFSEIQSGRLRAAFDVFWKEPYEGRLAAFHPDRFFMTPHVASNCEDFTAGLADDFRRFAKTI
ncbi:NAD(P)-dependent oxidoreductase [Pelagicoccus albus]|uniref:Hydroxyacid dehydrogenase n=1 Tax=Pelagicoccus albus TaxID=415222 RepID=A0A7X1EAM7_9BACT|nr:NAD(P)-dependent oxidoreductase [Pelagicoccus albus]MBC2606937.1 hydroxyacid dehydrogenase [Pelagicoccus albus]